MTTLDVHLYKTHLGRLSLSPSPTTKNRFDFETNPAVFERFSLSSTIMSIAVPLVLKQNRSHAARRQNFFTELLPEGRTLTNIALAARLSESDSFELLARYGLDLAGALEIRKADQSAQARIDTKPFLTVVNEARVRFLLEDTARYPLGNELLTGKTSLAGVQTKILLAQTNTGDWAQVHNGQPSTHIIKPPVHEYPTIIFDEAWGLELARACGLIHYSSWIELFADLPALVIERYDRDINAPGKRLHQEDFNQVLGASGAQKYQEHGGRVSLKRIAQTLQEHADHESIRALAKQLIFAITIGNLDMHAKNISVLHLPDESVRLAPAYDLVPLQHQNTDGRVAMSINGEYAHANLSIAHLVSELLSWETTAFQNHEETYLFTEELITQIEAQASEIPLPTGAHSHLNKTVQKNAKRLRAGKQIT